MITGGAIPTVSRKYHTLSNLIDERVLRFWAASEPSAFGWCGITALSEATGLSRTTIRAGTVRRRDLATLVAEDEESGLSPIDRPVGSADGGGGPTAAGHGCGISPGKGLPNRSDCGSQIATSRRRPASGTRPNTACSATSPRIGESAR